MNKVKPKILFVHEEFGRISEVFVYRMLISMEHFDVSILTGSYINMKQFPFPLEKISFWKNEEITFKHKLLPFINRKLHNKRRYSALHSVILSKIEKSEADLVCFQFGSLPVQLGKDIVSIGKKFCVIHHGTDVNRAIEDEAYKMRLIEVWKIASKIIFISKFLKDIGLSLGAPSDKTIVHYLGVPVANSFRYTAKKKLDEKVRFVCVARMVPVKNHLNLIRAFSKLIEMSENEVELTLIGSGPMEKEIRQEVSNLGISNNVKFTGALENKKVLSCMAHSDVVVLVSKVYVLKGKMKQEEGLGLSLLEGASYTLPMLGSNTGGIPEIVIHGETGYLVDPLDINSIMTSMLQMVENTGKRVFMGENAKKMVHSKFNMDLQMKKMEKIFTEIILDEKCH